MGKFEFDFKRRKNVRQNHSDLEVGFRLYHALGSDADVDDLVVNFEQRGPRGGMVQWRRSERALLVRRRLFCRNDAQFAPSTDCHAQMHRFWRKTFLWQELIS